MRPAIFLFDIDGVLIQPGGYRASVKASLTHFFGQMGLNLEFDENEIASLYESFGVTSEWDMVPITIALVLNTLAERIEQKVIFSSLAQVSSYISTNQHKPFEINLLKEIRRISLYFGEDVVPSNALFAANLREQKKGPFPAIWNDPVLVQLIKDTRHPERSVTYRIFQNYVLGDSIYSNTYNLPPMIKTESMLTLFDQPLLDKKWVAMLDAAKRDEKIFFAALTARPSMIPIGREVVSGPYSPEAEMAVSLLGFEPFPIIGYGRIHYLADRIKLPADSLIKPNPFQALAGIAAAWTFEEWPALVWGMQISPALNANGDINFVDSGVPLSRELPGAFDLHVFEDTPIGIQSTRAAADILTGLGYEIHTYCWGIANHVDKVSALRAAGATVYGTVDEAVQQAFFKRDS